MVIKSNIYEGICISYYLMEIIRECIKIRESKVNFKFESIVYYRNSNYFVVSYIYYSGTVNL